MNPDQRERRPNVLLIMADQLTAALTGAYGHPVVRTPHLNHLVAEGVRFDAAYSNCPVCTPARTALLSGRYVSNNRAYDNAAPWPADMVTLPHCLALAGYDTVLSGKMHFVGVAAREFEDLDTIRGRKPADGAGVTPGDAPQPFFLCVSYHHPHEPFWPPQKHWDMYEG